MAADSVQKIRGFRHLMLNDTSASGFRQIKPILHFKTSAADKWIARVFARPSFRGCYILLRLVYCYSKTNSCNCVMATNCDAVRFALSILNFTRHKVQKDNQNLLVTGDVDVIASIYRHERASRLPHDTAPWSYISASPNKWPSVAGCCGRVRHPVLQADGTCDRSLFERRLLLSPLLFASLSHILQLLAVSRVYHPFPKDRKSVV